MNKIFKDFQIDWQNQSPFSYNDEPPLSSGTKLKATVVINKYFGTYSNYNYKV